MRSLGERGSGRNVRRSVGDCRRIAAFAAAVLVLAPTLAFAAKPAPAPAPDTAPPVVTGLAVTAGDMVDAVSWDALPPKVAKAYRVERASEPSGPWAVLAETTRTVLADVVPAPGPYFYRVSVLGTGKRAGAPCAAVENSRLLLTAVVPPTGATLRAANGSLSLTLPAGCFEATATVRIADASVPAADSLVAVTKPYSFSSTLPLRAPAQLSVRYAVPITHFQVAGTVVKGASWMYFSEATGTWVSVPTTVDLAAGTLSAQMPHFSYWEGAFIQPHGTTSDKTDYCSTVCHSILAAPGSPTVLANSDSQVCYNCHGNTSAALPAAGSNGPNVQAAFFACAGQTFDGATSSRHPVRAPLSTSGLKCTNCHDPHKSPASSPKLLRSFDAVTGRAVASVNSTMPGNPYCWTCHGTVSNARINLLVPSYFANSGGDKKTTYAQTKHASGATSLIVSAHDRIDLKEDFEDGAEYASVRAYDFAPAYGVLRLLEGNLAPYVRSVSSAPAVAPELLGANLFDGNAWNGPTFGPLPQLGVAELTIDYGENRGLSVVRAWSNIDPSSQPDLLEVLVSDDGLSFTSVGTQGLLGVPRSSFDVWPAARGRYVRLRFTKQFPGPEGGAIYVGDMLLGDPGTMGTWTSGPRVISCAGRPTSSVVDWYIRYGLCSVEAAISPDYGQTWSGWQPVVKGGPLPGLDAVSDLGRARVKWRVTLWSEGSNVFFEWIDVSVTATNETRSVPSGGGVTGACGNCHSGHGSAGETGLLKTTQKDVCYGCHDVTLPRFQGGAAYGASAHGQKRCSACHEPHGRRDPATGLPYADLLRDKQTVVCFECHDEAANSKSGVDIEYQFTRWWQYPFATSTYLPAWSLRHNVDEGEQAADGTSMSCTACHGPHVASGDFTVVDPDRPSEPFTKTVPRARIATLPIAADSFVDSAGGAAQGGAAYCYISDGHRALVKYDLSGLPADAQVQSATAVLRGGSFLTTSFPTAIALYRVTSSWDESSVTWSDRGSALGAWTSPGGDYDPAADGQGRMTDARYDVTSLLQEWRGGAPNEGILIAPTGAVSRWSPLAITSREGAGSGVAGWLEVWYYPASGPDMVLDSNAFCIKCHDGGMPAGVSSGSRPLDDLTTGMYAYSASKHGPVVGTPPPGGSEWARGDGAGLRPPYHYGMEEPLQCTDCHDPHGSSNVYHLRDKVLGFNTVIAYHTWGQHTYQKYWCGACHTGDRHMWNYASNCFASCHGHHASGGGQF